MDQNSQNLNLATSAASRGDWDTAIAAAKKVPASWDPWQQLPSAGEMPDSAIHAVLDHLDRADPNGDRGLKHSFLFELSSNLPADTKPETLNRIAHAGKEDGYVTRNVNAHPNYQPDAKTQGMLDVGKFWNDYEREVKPHHFATVRAMHTGKTEQVENHRAPGTFGSSAEHEHLIPHLHEYAKAVQDEVMKDARNGHAKVKYFNGQPHVKVYRGEGGEYAAKIRAAAGHDEETGEVDRKNLGLPRMPFSSWSTDPEMAKSFATRRGHIEGQPLNKGVVLEKWMPVKDIVHSGYHTVASNQDHAHTNENELVFQHPDLKQKQPTSGISFITPAAQVIYKGTTFEDHSVRPAKVRPAVAKPKQSDAIGLAKMHPGPVFPKLGFPDDRRETPIVDSPTALAVKQHAVVNEVMHKEKYQTSNPSGLPVKQSGADNNDPAVIARTKKDWKADAYGIRTGFRNKQLASMAKKPALGAASITGNMTSYALGNALMDEHHTYNPANSTNGPLGTQLHENTHLMLQRVQNKYGVEARRNLVENLLNHIRLHAPQGNVALKVYAHNTHNVKPENPAYHEEQLASLLNYVNEPAGRDAFHRSMSHSPEKVREFGTHMKLAHRKLLEAGNLADENWLVPPSERSRREWAQIEKSEDLEKGQNGDWQAEGYTLHHELEPDGKATSVRMRLGGQVVGELDAAHSQAYPGTINPVMVKVHPDHQRKGIATALYQRAEQVLGSKFRRGSYQSPEAQALWSQKNRPFGKSDQPPENESEYLEKMAVLDPNAGYTFEHRLNHHTDIYETDPAKRHYQVSTVKARDAKGVLAGQAAFYHHPDSIEAGMVNVNPEHRRRGLASAIYAHAEKVTGRRVIASTAQTRDGKAFWARNEKLKQFGKSDQPPENESDYLPMKQWNDHVRSQYVKDGAKVASSREVPFNGTIPPVGTWALDHLKLNYGREISQLREHDPSTLEPSEHIPEREPDVQQYAEWSRQGKQAPPIDVVQTDAGGLRITDGHRRWRAAKANGQKVLGWVSPTAPHPQGAKDSNGTPMKVGLTYELAHPGKVQKSDDTSFDFGHNVDQKPPAEDLHAQALRTIARMHPAKRQVATDWVNYVKGINTVRPKIHPDLERHLARFGIVDPAGYHYQEDGRDMARPLGGKKVRGPEPEEFRRIRIMNLEHKLGTILGKSENLPDEDPDATYDSDCQPREADLPGGKTLRLEPFVSGYGRKL